MDYMFFYGYRCCMMKHGIIDDIPNIPSNNEVEAELEDGVRQGDDLGVRNRFATTSRED